MIPYEELVSALAQWRARNGLATEAESFLAGPAPSFSSAVQGAALPLAGGEIVDLEEEGALEEIDAYDEEVESAVAGIGDDAGESGSYASHEGAAGYADDAAAGYADDAAAGYAGDGYGDPYADQSAYGEQPAYEAQDAPTEGDAIVEVDDGFEVESVAVDDGFGPLEEEATAFSQVPEAPEGDGTRVGDAPDFADPDDPARSE